MKIRVLTILLCFSCFSVFSQKENNFWFLSSGLGLDFNRVLAGPGASPEVKSFRAPSFTISSSNLVSYSDEQGQLLFYSNGKKVWNKEHEVMQNGNLLSVQGGADILEAIAIRISCERYLVLYQVNLSGSNGSLLYSEIDMSLDEGRGGVIEDRKDLLLQQAAYRSFEIVSGPSFNWLVGVLKSGENTVEFHAFKIGQKEISEPIVTKLNYDQLQGLDYDLSFNSSGSTFAFIQRGLLFDGLPMYMCAFNKKSGVVNKLQTLIPEPPPLFNYNSNIVSAAFSPNQRYLYTIERYGYCEQLDCFTSFKVFQYIYDKIGKRVDLNSKFMLIFYDVEEPPIGEIALAPSGKLYLNRYGWPYFDVIASPNNRGVSCRYQPQRITLEKKTPLRMPNRVLSAQNYQFIFNEELSEPIALCEGKSMTLRLEDCYDEVKWSDGTTELSNTISEPGNYWVEVHQSYCVFRQDFKVTEFVTSRRLLPFDTILCRDEQVEIDLMNELGSDSLIWENGSTMPDRILAEDGVYWVELIDEGCTYKDSIYVDYDLLPKDVLVEDTLKCAQDEIRVSAAAFSAEYQWEDGSTDSYLDVYDSGVYRVTLTRGICSMKDSILVENKPDINLGLPDQVELCRGEALSLDVKHPELIQYKWSTGEQRATINTKHEGELSLLTSDGECNFTDTLDISRYHCVDAKIYLPNTFNPAGFGVNNKLVLGIPDNVTFIAGQMQIFDRYGNLVGSTEDFEAGWDGRINGKLIQPGLYALKVTMEVEDIYGLQNLEFIQSMTIFY